MKLLVTGGSGFIGGHLVELLEEKGHDVIIYDLKEPEWFTPKAEYIKGDILDTDHLKESADGTEGIFDCSGVLGSAETFDHIYKTFEVNLFGTLSVLETAKTLDIPVVYLSLKNEWKNPYMISKRAGTEACEMYFEYQDTKTCAIRGLNAYGPRQHWNPVRKMFPRFTMQLLTGNPITIFGDGDQIVDMIYVKDMAEIMLRAFENRVWGEVFDAGTGVPKTVLDVALDLQEEIGGEINFTPHRIGEPERAIALADPSFVKQILGYYPETSWKDGIKKTINWYRKHA